MNRSLRRLATLVSICSLILLPALAGADLSEVVQFRGPSGVRGEADLPGGEFGLVVSWTRDLGSGYSNVWIEGERAVTMYVQGENDVVGAFDAATGEPLWTYELGAMYAGHDGSNDGPIGTPVVSGDQVFALGPAGQLVALDLKSGAELWRHDLDEETSTVPFYGYTATPLVLGDRVVVATGGEGHAVTAYDRKSGAPLWSAGDDAVAYQTPMLAELGGRQQLIAPTNQFLYGIDPERGEMLWELRHTEGEETNESAHPTAVDGERFLVKYDRGSRLYRWTGSGVEEVWRSRAFGNTYALPVLVGNHLYGFTGSILTCARLDTGDIVWRSRQPGGLGLSEYDGKLAIAAPSGELVLVEADPEGYRELTRLPVLDRGNYAIPTVDGGTFFLRNLTQLAAVEIDASLEPQLDKVPDELRGRGAFGAWVASVESASENARQARVDEYFEKVDRTPIFGDGGLVHIVWRGDAEDVGVNGDFAPGGQELGLYAVAGTDLFFRTFELRPEGQYTYSLIVDYADPSLDPGNPHLVDNGFARASDLRMPGFAPAPHLEEPAAEAPRGTIDRFQFRSEILDNAREIRVWRPADYDDDAERRYPVLVVNHGDNLLRGGLFANTLDNLVGRSVAPLVAVFVPRAAGPEYGGAAADDYNRFLLEELLPHVDRHYRTDAATRAILGPGSAGVAAIYMALSHPEAFQRAAAQSFYAIDPVQERLPELIANADGKPDLLYVVFSRQDYDLGPGLKAEETSRELLERLRAGGFEVREQIVDYSPGWAGWRGQDDDILQAFFPMQKE